MKYIPCVTVAAVCTVLAGCSSEDVAITAGGGGGGAFGSSTSAPSPDGSQPVSEINAPAEPSLTAPVAPVSPLAPVAPLAPVSPNATDTGSTTLIPEEVVPVEEAPVEFGSVENPETATFRITFDADWTADRHPVQFPVGADHFSGLVGAVHNEQVIFFEPGQIASNGIEFMAETGGTSLFVDEINFTIQNGSSLSLIDGAGIESGNGEVSVEVTVSVDYPQITVTSMVAPSPDWFVGLHNFDLHNGVSFIDGATVDAIVYDAGTDSGVTYTSENEETQPRQPILPTSSEAQDSSFVDGLPSAGQFIIERL